MTQLLKVSKFKKKKKSLETIWNESNFGRRSSAPPFDIYIFFPQKKKIRCNCNLEVNHDAFPLLPGLTNTRRVREVPSSRRLQTC